MKPCTVLALALACVSCTTTYYEWGRYEDSVYAVTSQPDGFDLGAEIDALEQQVDKSIDKERPVPPGLHAHLGYLHSVAGNPTAARAHFEQEKALYPESARFIDHLLARLAPGT
ncbi:MAG: DUF4810 domain-containing protein [Planctomycetes bacterium]|nr:DUF4810 domain-containing protein [Planctomycetota bacterium]